MFESKIEKATTLEQLKIIIENKKVGMSPMCKSEKCEENLKFETKGAKTLFINEKNPASSQKCIICNNKAEYNVYIGKTY